MAARAAFFGAVGRLAAAFFPVPTVFLGALVAERVAAAFFAVVPDFAADFLVGAMVTRYPPVISRNRERPRMVNCLGVSPRTSHDVVFGEEPVDPNVCAVGQARDWETEANNHTRRRSP